MIQVTLENAVKWTSEAVKGREDFTYGNGSCVYIEGVTGHWDEGEEYMWDLSCAKPSCLVGEALITHGGLPMMDILTDSFNNTDAMHLLEKLQEEGKLTFTQEAAEFLLRAQDRQDQGWTWGDSLAYAKQAL